MGYRTLLALVVLASAAPAIAQEDSSAKTTVRVLVPGGMVGPFSEIVPKFETAHLSIRVQWEPNNMVIITEKLLAGTAQADVFLSLGDVESDRLRRADLLLPSTYKDIAPNSLALLAPVGNPADIHSLQDLAQPGVRAIGVPDPKLNSAGAHAVEALRRAGVWKSVEPKIVYVKYVAETQQMVRENRLQAAIVYYPCTVEVREPGKPPQPPHGEEVVARISPELFEPFSCGGAVLKQAGPKAEAETLLAFLAGPEAAPIWRKWQFVPSP